jgi:bacterioferritin
MSQHEQVIAQLNEVLNLQLLAIDQFYLHARLYKKWGLNTLATLSSDKSRELMLQANQLFEHIQQLGGDIQANTPDSMLTGTAMIQCMELDHKIVAQCLTACLSTIEICNEISDSKSINILKQFIHQSESHHEWLRSELEFIRTRGLQAFIRNEMGLDQYWKLAAN